MGARPRLGSEGRLRLPAAVTIGRPADPAWPGDVHARFDLADLDDPAVAERHLTDPFARRADGLLLAESFVRLDLRRPRKARDWFLANGVPALAWFDGEGLAAPDGGRDVVFEQDQVRAYLRVIELISRTLPPPAGQGVAWDDAWFPPTTGLYVITDEAADVAQPRILLDLALGSLVGYLSRAMSPEIDPRGVRGRPVWPPFPGAAPEVFGPVVRYRWPSIIAPIYLQLYEGLRRLSEGKPGARTCAECGELFLVLDGRRTTFCTDAERARHHQRRYREREARPA